MMIRGNYYDSVSMAFGTAYCRPELSAMSETYMRIRDALNNRVKARGKCYLDDPSEVREDAKIKEARYRSYIARATWLPVTRRTQQGLTAQVFIKSPVAFLSDRIPQTFLASASPLGNLDAYARYALSEVIALGRGAVVVNQVDNGKVMLDFIESENIVTWSDLPYGMLDGLGRSFESATVRSFATITEADQITVKTYSTLTQFRLDSENRCFMRKSTSQYGSVIQTSTNWSGWELLIVGGEPLDYIPVFPIGAELNTFDIQTPPLEELTELNISHFINSADYEEHVKVAGQVTPVITGLDQSWYDKNIRGQVAFGVRSPLSLPKEGNAFLLQASANSVAKEALDKKEKMMVSVGARLIEERSIRRTATEADIEDQSYHSILGHIAHNVSSALTSALQHVCRLSNQGEVDDSISYALNTDFSTITSSAEHRRLLLEEYVGGVRTFEEYRKALKLYDQTITMSADDAKQQIEEELDFRKSIADSGKKPDGSDNRT